jgi:hypothetical protein
MLQRILVVLFLHKIWCRSYPSPLVNKVYSMLYSCFSKSVSRTIQIKWYKWGSNQRNNSNGIINKQKKLTPDKFSLNGCKGNCKVYIVIYLREKLRSIFLYMIMARNKSNKKTLPISCAVTRPWHARDLTAPFPPFHFHLILRGANKATLKLIT